MDRVRRNALANVLAELIYLTVCDFARSQEGGEYLGQIDAAGIFAALQTDDTKLGLTLCPIIKDAARQIANKLMNYQA